jgi:hypothetical protein
VTLLVIAQSIGAHAAVRPTDDGETSVRGAFTSGVVGSLTLRALLLQSSPSSSNGAPAFTCECLKLDTPVQTASGVRTEIRTFCE